jgi:hypothetical protein
MDDGPVYHDEFSNNTCNTIIYNANLHTYFLYILTFYCAGTVFVLKYNYFFARKNFFFCFDTGMKKGELREYIMLALWRAFQTKRLPGDERFSFSRTKNNILLCNFYHEGIWEKFIIFPSELWIFYFGFVTFNFNLLQSWS